jgi:hypothetical protein
VQIRGRSPLNGDGQGHACVVVKVRDVHTPDPLSAGIVAACAAVADGGCIHGHRARLGAGVATTIVCHGNHGSGADGECAVAC